MSKKIVMIPVFCESHLIKYQIPNIIDTINPDIIVYNEGLMPAGPESHGLPQDFVDKYTLDGKRGFDFNDLKKIISSAQKKYPNTKIILNEMEYTGIFDASTCYTKACSNFEELGIDVNPGDYIFPYEGDVFHHETSKDEIQGYLDQLDLDTGFTSTWIDFIGNQYYAFKSTLKPFLKKEWENQKRARRICIRFGTWDFYLNELMNFQKQQYPNLYPTDLLTYHYAWWRPGKFFELRKDQLTNRIRPHKDFWKNFTKAYQDIDKLLYNEIRVYSGDKKLTGKWVKYWNIEHPKHIKEHPNYSSKTPECGIEYESNIIDKYDPFSDDVVKKLHILGIKNWYDHDTNLAMFDERHKTTKIENDNCRMSEVVVQTHNINDADIIWFRSKPEALSEKEIPMYKSLLDRHSDKTIINHIDYHRNYDSKDRCYGIWKENDIKCPECIVVNKFEDVLSFLKKYNKICLRINNEAGGNYLKIIDKNTPVENIEIIYNELENARIRQVNGVDYRNHLGGKARGARLDTKVIAVEFLKLPKMKHLHRVIVVGDKIVGGYSVAAEVDNIHLRDQTYENIQEFIIANRRLGELCLDENFINMITKSVSVLGIQIGAIEFFEIDGIPYLIELNSTWAGSGGFTFWDDRISTYLKENKSELQKQLWPLYRWNGTNQYLEFYKSFKQF